MTWSVWLIVAIAFFIAEIVTPGLFFFACLGIGALGGTLAALLWPGSILPWIAWVAVSIVSIYSIRPVARRMFPRHNTKSNIDALIGRKAWVTEKIEPHRLGQVKIEGDIWRAEAEVTIEPEQWVEVVRVEGTRLFVKTI